MNVDVRHIECLNMNIDIYPDVPSEEHVKCFLNLDEGKASIKKYIFQF